VAIGAAVNVIRPEVSGHNWLKAANPRGFMPGRQIRAPFLDIVTSKVGHIFKRESTPRPGVCHRKNCRRPTICVRVSLSCPGGEVRLSPYIRPRFWALAFRYRVVFEPILGLP